MNVMQRVTLATLKKNRRRTVVTVLGTAVAVAMVTAIAVLASSFSDMGRRSAIHNSGDWHVSFRGLDSRGVEYLAAQEGIESLELSYENGFARLPGQEEYTRQALLVTGYDAAAYTHLPLEVLEGRLPASPGEVLLPANFSEATGLDWPVGTSVTLEQGYYYYEATDDEGQPFVLEMRERYSAIAGLPFAAESETTLTVVGYADLGYLDSRYGDYYTALTLLEPASLAEGDFSLTAWIRVPKPSDKIYDQFNSVEVGLQDFYASQGVAYEAWANYNSELLAFNGVLASATLLQVFGSFIAVLLLIVVAGSVSLVSNAFSISLTERVRALGMLAGVGATKKQKRASVFFEALVIGAVAIPLGILGGIAGIGVTLYFLGDAIGNAVFGAAVPYSLSVSVWAVLFTVVFSAGILLLSAWLPARRASKIAPIDAMRAGGKNESIRRTRPARLTRRLLGFEAEIGIKNSKRSRRRYFAILSSLVISVALFISVSSAMQYIRQSAGIVMGADSATVQVSINWRSDNPAGMLVAQQSLRTAPGMGNMTVFESQHFYTDIPLDELPAQVLGLMQQANYNLEDGYATYAVPVYALADEDFDAYCAELGLDTAAFGGEGLDAILLRSINGRNPVTNGWGVYETTRFAAGDTLRVETQWYPDGYENDAYVLDVAIRAVADTPPAFVSMDYYGVTYQPLVVRWSQYQALAGAFYDPDTSRGMLAFTDAADSATTVTGIENATWPEGVHVYSYDLYASMLRTRMMVMVFEVFTYGFVVLISLVCAANIFNTVSTGIALRTREFAMLRSAGLTPGGFRRMMDCETVFYGVKALLWGLPLGFLLSLLLYRILQDGISLSAGFSLPLASYAIAVAGVFLLVGASALYARRKITGLNIAETLKNENW